ncbi:uncharacterized protein [Spinacia oleracea]|uniref:Reverse transcriptase zinc-binding domain-containing protein n=1 Tax=Spinacia oleracea TaxID=3562 RepID=A0ABM3QXW8_SPIOL|nr:uncharacterized protein LOC110781351 [Spinacia oleracea]
MAKAISDAVDDDDGAVLKKINAICRAYLWFGSYADNRPGAVAWEKLCCTKSEGGLGFRNLVLWNQAPIGKQAWAISKKEDNLWVKWVHAMYVKDRNWVQYTAPITASWAVKIVCKVKNMFNGKLQSHDWLTANKYAIKGMYQNLSEVQTKAHWAKQVWNRHSVPRHRFTMWLASQDRLKTRARLVKVGIGNDSQCTVCCCSEETITHMYFGCAYSASCKAMVFQWLGLSGHGGDLHRTLNWLRRQGTSRFRRQVIYAAYAGLIYHLWRARNYAVWDAMVPTVLQTVKRVKMDTKGRIQQLIGKKVKASDVEWFSGL